MSVPRVYCSKNQCQLMTLNMIERTSRMPEAITMNPATSICFQLENSELNREIPGFRTASKSASSFFHDSFRSLLYPSKVSSTRIALPPRCNSLSTSMSSVCSVRASKVFFAAEPVFFITLICLKTVKQSDANNVMSHSHQVEAINSISTLLSR